ncbi:hypothetical protein QAD02_014998 [Eretmocerus hayati]|uniref:Uncharacterized protein n=1 Tax=Eretmocerus hayati TaxID=131215 RepID=A0ACC2P8M5_9HYME|nr:hypothetical protein QAD02_014998 [Eretmocerus hayati]
MKPAEIFSFGEQIVDGYVKKQNWFVSDRIVPKVSGEKISLLNSRIRRTDHAHITVRSIYVEMMMEIAHIRCPGIMGIHDLWASPVSSAPEEYIGDYWRGENYVCGDIFSLAVEAAHRDQRLTHYGSSAFSLIDGYQAEMLEIRKTQAKPIALMALPVRFPPPQSAALAHCVDHANCLAS